MGHHRVYGGPRGPTGDHSCKTPWFPEDCAPLRHVDVLHEFTGCLQEIYEVHGGPMDPTGPYSTSQKCSHIAKFLYPAPLDEGFTP
uniref:Uncharacterized protein n=1 Tax=Acrobeloides nanus TaxID=290746 RepID=A0A914DFW7_9BILA